MGLFRVTYSRLCFPVSLHTCVLCFSDVDRCSATVEPDVLRRRRTVLPTIGAAAVSAAACVMDFGDRRRRHAQVRLSSSVHF